MNKPVTITTEVVTPHFTIRLNAVLGLFTIEAHTRVELETFLKTIGMDSHKRMGAIEVNDSNYAYLDVDLHDFSHALWYLARLF